MDFGQWHSGGTPSRSISFYYGGSIPWYSSGELNNLFISVSKEHITNQALQESAAKLIEPGSLLLGMYDTAALKSSIAQISCSCNQAIAFSKFDDKILNVFYAYYTIQFGKEFLKASSVVFVKKI